MEGGADWCKFTKGTYASSQKRAKRVKKSERYLSKCRRKIAKCTIRRLRVVKIEGK